MSSLSPLYEQYLDSTGMFKDAILSIIATVAKQERVRLSERVKAGLARARGEGKRIGRAPIDSELVATMRDLKAAGIGVRAIARELSLAPSTVSKYLAAGTG